VRVEANSGSQANGRQTLWFNGEQAGEWSNIRFRTDDALKINALGLWHYVTDDSYAAGQTQQTIWFDDVVVSRGPIGCGGSVDGGGVGGTGGSSGSAGTAGATSGGSAGTGASGGAPPGTGGAAGTGANAGSSNAGRGSGGNASGGSAGRNAAAPESDSSCACRQVQSSHRGVPFTVVAGVLAVLGMRGRRFRQKRRDRSRG
jgi:hypothetical protein